MRRRLLPLLALPLILGGCSLTDSISQAFNVFSVSFSSATPAYSGPDITYTPNGILPHLSYFNLVMTFHVNADNRKNTQRAAFGSSVVQPVLNFRISSRTAVPISTPIPAFSVAGGQDTTLDFPVSVPLSTIADPAVVRAIVAGTPIPYYLSGTLNFNLMEGLTIKGSGNSEIDLATGDIPTRPSSGILSVLTPLLP